jgi:predicted nucleic acid-binding Zn ribbon protein
MVNKSDYATRTKTAKLGNLLETILSNYGLARTFGGWKIVVNWPEIVGAAIARVSHAIRFENDTLLISVPDSGWRQQLSLQQDMILEKIHDYPGGKAVKKIHFVAERERT